MPGVELSTSARAGHVALALRGELEITGATDAEAAVTALVAPGRSLIIDLPALDFIDCSSLSALLRVHMLARCAGGDVVLAAPQREALRLLDLTGKDGRVRPSCQRGGRRCENRQLPDALRWARAWGEHRAPWEHSAIAYLYRVIAAGAAAALAGAMRGRVRG
jgi:anti-anti-sigma factor